MIIQKVTDMCIKDNSCLQKTSFSLDWITAAAFLVFGSMGAFNVIPMGVGVAYGFVGGGFVYGIMMSLQTSTMIHVNCSSKHGKGSKFNFDVELS